MKKTQVLAAGSAVFTVWLISSGEAEAAPKNEHPHEFCRGAPDLCVFVSMGRHDRVSLSLSHGV
jgi:hypothetical protein